MTNELIAVVADCETGEQIVRPFTPEEISAYEAIKLATEEENIRMQAEIERINSLKQSAKSKLIAGQPLTQEEADILVI